MRADGVRRRSEEHTSELQSLTNLVCRLLLEKKKLVVCVCPHGVYVAVVVTRREVACARPRPRPPRDPERHPRAAAAQRRLSTPPTTPRASAPNRPRHKPPPPRPRP